MTADPTHAPAPLTLRVLTVNVHKGFAHFSRRFVLHELRDAVRGVDADLVFLQEVQGVHSLRARHVPRWPAQPHYEFLADSLWPQFAYGRNAVYPDGHHGNAVLSKYPIVEHRNHDVSVGTHEARGLLHCTLQVPGRHGVIHAICVHLGLVESHRHHQVRFLCKVVGRLLPARSPVLVAGDFNDWRNQAHELLSRCSDLHEVFVRAQGRAARSFPALLPLLRLDRIYVRNARAHRPVPLPRLPWARLSDHAPLAAEITL